jgi:hypothetical protein
MRSASSLAWWVKTSIVTVSPELTSSRGGRDRLKKPQCTVLSLAGRW